MHARPLDRPHLGRPGRAAARCIVLCAVGLLAGCATPPPWLPTLPGMPAPGATPTTPPAPAPAPGGATAPVSPAAQAAQTPTAPAPPTPPPPPALPFDQAVVAAATQLFTNAQLPPGGPLELVIDPLIDGVTGAQSNATRELGQRIGTLLDARFPRFRLQPFSAQTVKRGPLLLVGTFTGVNAQRKTEGLREAYRICLALGDLRTGRLIGKGLAFALPDGVDPEPLAFFRDAPALIGDDSTTGYIRTCQGTKAGDPIHPFYLDRIVTAATIAEAINAYGSGRYREALSLYEAARGSPGGEQLRVYTGLYLSNMRLGRTEQASDAFGGIVDHGLSTQRLGVKFLFRAGTTALWTAPGTGPQPYGMWLREIARRVAARPTCLEVVGHTSPTGPEPLNERLSLLRAETIRRQLHEMAPALSRRTIANGVGSREALVGNGRDDASDALDRRVEFKVLANC